METIGIVVIVATGVLIYFVPSVVALVRDHPKYTPIVVVNFLLGWTLLGWVAALAMALTHIQSVPERRR